MVGETPGTPYMFLSFRLGASAGHRTPRTLSFDSGGLGSNPAEAWPGPKDERESEKKSTSQDKLSMVSPEFVWERN